MTADHRTSYEELASASVLFPLAPETFVRLRGQDAKGWLQGQVSQDLRDLGPGDSTDACLLKPTGQIEAVATVYVVQDGAVIAITDPEPLRERVRRFVIMEDVSLVETEAECASLQGPESTLRLASIVGATASDVVVGELGGVRVEAYRSPRTEPGGWDLVYPAGQGAAVRSALGNPVIGDDALLHLAMLEIGAPVAGVDIWKRTLPPELGPQFEARTISYKKGCFSGREVMARIKSRGHTNLTWVRLAADEPIEPCASLTAPDGSEAGTVTRFAESPRLGTIGAAWVRNRWSEPGTTLRSGSRTVQVTAWPSFG